MSVQRKTLLLGLLASSLAVAQSGPPRQPAAGAPAQPPAPTAASEPEAGEEARVISTQERFLPGSAPHSPSTWGHSLEDPTNLRHTAGAFGGLGVLHVSGADLGPRGLLRFSAEGEYFGAKDFPVLGSSNVRSAGAFAVSFVPLDLLEAYLAYGASANTNSHSSPSLIQALGDLTLGAKVARKWAPGLYAGMEVRVLSFSGVGSQDVSSFSFGLAPSLLATYDVRDRWPRVPLRLHTALGMAFDGTGGLGQQHTLSAAEEFALGVNRYSRFLGGVAAEAPLPGATPFVEYNLAVPLGVSGGTLAAPDGSTVQLTQVMPQRLALGVKVTAIRDVTLMAAVDIGLTRQVGLGVPATPPLNFIAGASFAVDPLQRGETKVVETIRERKVAAPVQVVAKEEPPKTGKVEGVVVDAKTHKPIPGVIVAMVGAGLPPVASDAESGRFLTHELPSGPVKLAARKEGYKEVAREVQLEAGKVTNVELALEAVAKKSHFAVSVTSNKKPVAATVAFKGAQEQQVAIKESSKEPVKLEAAPGHYIVTVNAPGYLAQTRDVQISDGAELALAFDLIPEPKKKLVAVKENKIEILQQVRFASGNATILPSSATLLASVVDAIVRNDFKKIRIEGHTDNKGSKSANLKLSQDRARAVGDYLVKAGIEPARIETAGFGDTRPIAPNMTARGRELNRRVEFIIVER